MTKTIYAVGPRKGKLEMVVSAAMVAALASLSTAENIDLSSVAKSVGGGGLTRAVNKEYVMGDDEAISDYDTRMERGPFQINFLYTNGEEQLGTDDLDPYTILKELAEYTGSDLSVQFIFSPAGGNIGDEQFTTDLNQSFITALDDPVGGADSNGKIAISMSVDSPSYTASTVA